MHIYDFCTECGCHAKTSAYDMTKDDEDIQCMDVDELTADLYANYHMLHLTEIKKHIC